VQRLPVPLRVLSPETAHRASMSGQGCLGLPRVDEGKGVLACGRAPRALSLSSPVSICGGTFECTRTPAPLSLVSLAKGYLGSGRMIFLLARAAGVHLLFSMAIK
jgi:hypothetical protein